MYSTKYPKIGEIYAVSFEKKAHEQAGWRPAVVIQNKLGNIFAKNVVVLPLTSVIKRDDMVTHVILRSDDTGLRKDSIVLCENPVTIPKSYLRKYITTLNSEYIKEIGKAYLLSSGLITYLDLDDLDDIRTQALDLNREEGVSCEPL